MLFNFYSQIVDGCDGKKEKFDWKDEFLGLEATSITEIVKMDKKMAKDFELARWALELGCVATKECLVRKKITCERYCASINL